MEAFNHLSARALIRPMPSFHEVRFSGVLGRPSFCALRLDVMDSTRGANVLVLRLEDSILALADVPEPPSINLLGMPAGAYVVNDEQYGQMAAYSRMLAGVGVRRVVFLRSQLLMAYRWAEIYSNPRTR